MGHERNFAHTIQDLDKCVVSGTAHDIASGSIFVRKLLLDDPLIHKVNVNKQLKLTFTVVDDTSKPPGSPDAWWRNLDPTIFPSVKTLSLKLDPFLSTPCLDYKGATATVLDVIKIGLYVKGGAHFGDADSPEKRMVLDFDEITKVLGEEPSAFALRGLYAVILRGLEPLVKALESSNP